MSTLSNEIELFIKQLLGEDDECVSIQRNELADHFNCAPSQINYVLMTRFSPDRGYVVESRRGGGGYIKVIRVHRDVHDYIRSLIEGIPERGISERTMKKITEDLLGAGYIDIRHAKTVYAALSDRTLAVVEAPYRDRLRAHILKQILNSMLA